MLNTRADLLAYFNARSLPALERQFNEDGRLVPILIDARGDSLMIVSHPKSEVECIATFTFPVHVSDLLGAIERDRQYTERRVAH